MNDLLTHLANQNFYATTDTIRSFFSLCANEKAYAVRIAPEDRNSISSYDDEYTTISISGLMLREQSIFTDLGWATSTEEVISEIQTARSQDKKVKLVINSGGGLVSGTSNLADIIYEHRDHIEAYATGMVASAAMWVYSAAGTRYAEPTTVMGSIGVVTSVLDDEEYWKAHGVIWKDIVSENAKNKRPDVKTDSGQAEVKRYLTSLETVFLDTVSRNLDMSKDDVISKFHEGGLITGSDALEINVIASLTSYDLATMPTEPQADKIAIQNTGGDPMEITQEQFDAVNDQLTASVASVKDLNAKIVGFEKEISEHTANLAKANELNESLEAKQSALPEIIGMAFEHNVGKDTAIEMVKVGDQDKASAICLKAVSSTGSTHTPPDLGASQEEADAEAKKAEQEYALGVAKSLSVTK